MTGSERRSRDSRRSFLPKLIRGRHPALSLVRSGTGRRTWRSSEVRQLRFVGCCCSRPSSLYPGSCRNPCQITLSTGRALAQQLERSLNLVGDVDPAILRFRRHSRKSSALWRTIPKLPARVPAEIVGLSRLSDGRTSGSRIDDG